MKNTALKVLLTAAVLIPVAVYAQPRPGNPTTATVITKAEIGKISATEQSQRVRDENAKVVDAHNNARAERERDTIEDLTAQETQRQAGEKS